MDQTRQFELEGRVNLSDEIMRTWYAEENIRYIGGFFRFHIKPAYSYIWGHTFLKKEVAKPQTIKTYDWQWVYGFIPVRVVTSTKEELRWKSIWTLRTDSDSRGYIIRSDRTSTENDPSLDTLKAVAAQCGMKLGKDLLIGVFQEPLDIVTRLHLRIFGHL